MRFWSVSVSVCIYVQLCSGSADFFFLVSAICLFVGGSQASVKKAYCCDTTASNHKWAITPPPLFSFFFFRVLAICLFTILWHVSLFSHTLILRNKSDSITTDWLKPLYQYSTSWINVTSLCMVDLVWHTPRAVDRAWINRSVLPSSNKARQLERKWQVQ